MMKYPWAQNRFKLERALEEAHVTGNESEENIKAIYVRLSGKVLGETKEEVVLDEKPKKKKK